MKTTAAILLLLLTTAAIVSLLGLASFASATWFGSGEHWQDKAKARWHVERACKGYDGNAGKFQGVFKPGETRSLCVQHSGTQKLDFIIKNENQGASIDLGDDDCVLRLQNEINGCNEGGWNRVSGWYFSSDPNNGLC
ncbi:hypothetical protein FALBO_12222 [Fusarium albosuccineum]|uniref:Glycan binding protein Y3-like domain-containing protein n=1 Tax=Fusarium albosuccineum TaxID=1237068 RepID=A0A8H4L298_9HYPO|nr:hypothetical protein FALBO_12222 [Fusarium albosuccineum]